MFSMLQLLLCFHQTRFRNYKPHDLRGHPILLVMKVASLARERLSGIVREEFVT